MRESGSGVPHDHRKKVRDGLRAVGKLKHTLGKAILGRTPGSPAASEPTRLADDVLDLVRRAEAVVDVEP